MKRHIIFALIAIIAGGCSTMHGVRSDYALNKNSGKGLLIASLTYHGSYSGYRMYYRKQSSKKRKHLLIGSGISLIPPGLMEWDISKPGLRGNVLSVELPSGEYEFYSWAVSSGYANIGPSEAFSLKFTIKPGEANYVGNFQFDRISGMGAMVTGVDVSYNDETDRDLKVIKEKHSLLNIERITRSVKPSTSVHMLGDGNNTSITTPVFIP